jgi:hypothetical protein
VWYRDGGEVSVTFSSFDSFSHSSFEYLKARRTEANDLSTSSILEQASALELEPSSSTNCFVRSKSNDFIDGGPYSLS